MFCRKNLNDRHDRCPSTLVVFAVGGVVRVGGAALVAVWIAVGGAALFGGAALVAVWIAGAVAVA